MVSPPYAGGTGDTHTKGISYHVRHCVTIIFTIKVPVTISYKQYLSERSKDN